MANKDSIRQMKYDKENCTRIGLKLNNVTDADIIAKLNVQQSMQGYIKSLIRADIETNPENSSQE